MGNMGSCHLQNHWLCLCYDLSSHGWIYFLLPKLGDDTCVIAPHEYCKILPDRLYNLRTNPLYLCYTLLHKLRYLRSRLSVLESSIEKANSDSNFNHYPDRFLFRRINCLFHFTQSHQCCRVCHVKLS